MGLKSLKKEPSLAEKAYTAIKEAIISNELTPGTALAEDAPRYSGYRWRVL